MKMKIFLPENEVFVILVHLQPQSTKNTNL